MACFKITVLKNLVKSCLNTGQASLVGFKFNMAVTCRHVMQIYETTIKQQTVLYFNETTTKQSLSKNRVRGNGNKPVYEIDPSV